MEWFPETAAAQLLLGRLALTWLHGVSRCVGPPSIDAIGDKGPN
jgi:hypothetical protein